MGDNATVPANSTTISSTLSTIVDNTTTTSIQKTTTTLPTSSINSTSFVNLQPTITDNNDTLLTNVTETTTSSLTSVTSTPFVTTIKNVTEIPTTTLTPKLSPVTNSTYTDTTTLFIYEEHSDDITIVIGILVPIAIVLILVAVFVFYQKYWKKRKYEKRRAERAKVSFSDNPVVTGSVLKAPRYSDGEECNTNIFADMPDKQDGFVTIDLSDNGDAKTNGGINIVANTDNTVVNQSLESICEKEELFMESDEGKTDDQTLDIENNAEITAASFSKIPNGVGQNNEADNINDNKTLDEDNGILKQPLSANTTQDNKSDGALQDNKSEDAVQDNNSEDVEQENESEDAVQDNKSESATQDNKSEDVKQENKSEDSNSNTSDTEENTKL